MNTIEKYFDLPAVFQQPLTSYNDFNEPVTEWEDFKQVMGRLRPLSGEKRIAASREAEFITHRFYCSYFADVIPAGCILLIGNVKYNIKFIQNVMSADRLLQIDLELIV